MVTAAAIAGHDGNIWAKSNGFNASPDEVKRLLRTGDQTWRWAESLSTPSSTCSCPQTRRWCGERKAALVSTSTRQVRLSLLPATASRSLQNSVPLQLRSWVTTSCLLAIKGIPFDKRQLVLL